MCALSNVYDISTYYFLTLSSLSYKCGTLNATALRGLDSVVIDTTGL